MADAVTPELPAPLLRRRLLRWYDAHRRAMPWRAGTPGAPDQPNAYHVLLSETMLQQTQVATVIAYFQRFIQALPTLEDLAQADEQTVLRLWQGLGYYRRARNLHRAAQAVMSDFQGQMPTTAEQLRQLPGVGRYTAGAVASIAFNQREPVVDGNVIRVLARLTDDHRPVQQPNVQRDLWSHADQLVSPARPGDFNQALMELGATVCTPRAPQCMICPLQSLCQAFHQGTAEDRPVKKPKAPAQTVHHIVIAIQRKGRFLFEQRPDSGMWSKLWQMPTCQDPLPTTQHAAWIKSHTGLTVDPPRQRGSFEHPTTHRRIRFTLWACTATQGRLKPNLGQWLSLAQAQTIPLAVPQQRVVQLLKDAPVAGI